MKPIPTTYNSVNYRSRLEAKWAAFFDLLGWQHQYEPCDFDGWMPDFLITGELPVYVEVKPYSQYGEWEEVMNKIDKSGCESDVLLCGITGVFAPPYYENFSSIGILGEGAGQKHLGFSICGVWDSESVNTAGIIGFCHSEGYYGDRITGAYNGGSRGRFGKQETAVTFRNSNIGVQPIRKTLCDYWAQACNAVQYVPKKSSFNAYYA